MNRGTYIHPMLDLDSAVRSLLDSVDDPVLALNRSAEVLIYNMGMQRLTDYRWQEVVGQDWLGLVLPDEKEQKAARDSLLASLDGVEIGETRWVVTRKNGTRRTVLFRPIPLSDASGRVVAVFSTLPDLTESEEPILSRTPVDLEEELTALLFRIDNKTGRLLYIGRGAQVLLGYTPEEFYKDQRLFLSRVKPDYDEALESAIRGAAHGVARNIELGFVHRKGQEVILALLLYPVKDQQGNVITIEGIARDITSRKEAGRQLEQSIKELQAAYQQLQVQHEELQSVDRLKSQILANVSHELRTPLVTIKGYNELMSQGALGELADAQIRALTISRRSIGRLMSLIENLLDFASLDRYGFRLPETRMDLCAILLELMKELGYELGRKKLDLVLEGFEGQVQVRGDRKRLLQVFRNLLDNAIKFSSDRGKIVVRLDVRSGQEATVEIIDEGIGIPENEQVKIFDSFYQVDGSSTRSHAGVGIGLAVARELIELHGGSIQVRSKVGKGAVFTVSLPMEGKTTSPDSEERPVLLNAARKR